MTLTLHFSVFASKELLTDFTLPLMVAQALTPFLVGLFMEGISNKALLPYALIFICLAFVTMSMVKHGNASDKPISDKNLFN